MKSAFWGWSDTRVFLAVLREGSTLAAAKTLGMAQPTVSRRIDALEHGLRLTLFERDTRGFHPTPEALTLRDAAEAMERAAETLEGAANAARSAPKRPIRLTAPPQNFSPGFVQILDDFRAEHPGTLFEFVSSFKVLDLAAGEADVAIRISKTLDDDRLICRKLTEATVSLYAARSYADLHGLPTSLDDLEGHRFIVIDPAPRSVPVNRWLLDNCAPGQIVSRNSDIDGVIVSARSGLGIAPIPTTLAADHPDLVRCFPPPEGTGVPVWLVISPRAWARPEIKAFASFFAPRWIAHIEQVKAAIEP